MSELEVHLTANDVQQVVLQRIDVAGGHDQLAVDVPVVLPVRGAAVPFNQQVERFSPASNPCLVSQKLDPFRFHPDSPSITKVWEEVGNGVVPLLFFGV